MTNSPITLEHINNIVSHFFCQNPPFPFSCKRREHVKLTDLHTRLSMHTIQTVKQAFPRLKMITQKFYKFTHIGQIRNICINNKNYIVSLHRVSANSFCYCSFEQILSRTTLCFMITISCSHFQIS